MEVYQDSLKKDDPLRDENKDKPVDLTMDDFEKMSPIELTQQLIAVAAKGEHREFELINTLQEAETALLLAKATKKVVKQFCKMMKNSFKRYTESIKNNKPALLDLIAYQDFAMAADFYEIEYEIIYADLSDYVSYLFHGHIIDTLLGRTRDEVDE